MTTNKYSYIRLEPADNGGVILSYDERGEAPMGKDYCCPPTQSKKEVYTKAELGQAVKKMLSLVSITVELMDHDEEENVVVKIKS